MLVGDIGRKTLIELTKLAKISCKAFSYSAIPDLFLDLRSSKMEKTKGIELNPFKNKFLVAIMLFLLVG